MLLNSSEQYAPALGLDIKTGKVFINPQTFDQLLRTFWPPLFFPVIMLLFPFSVVSFAASVAAVEMYAMVDVNAVLGFDTGPDNFYNAPTPPWVAGATPGWYYGPNPEKYPDLWCLHEVSIASSP